MQTSLINHNSPMLGLFPIWGTSTGPQVNSLQIAKRIHKYFLFGRINRLHIIRIDQYNTMLKRDLYIANVSPNISPCNACYWCTIIMTFSNAYELRNHYASDKRIYCSFEHLVNFRHVPVNTCVLNRSASKFVFCISYYRSSQYIVVCGCIIYVLECVKMCYKHRTQKLVVLCCV